MLHNIIEAIFSFTIRVIEAFGYWGVFVLSALESANIPIPSEVIMPFSGFLASQGDFNFWFVVFLGGFGNLVGSLISYYIATKWGRGAIERFGKYVFMDIADLDKAEEAWFKRYGELSVFIARFVPIVRTFISFPAGMFRVNIWRFIILTFIGSFIWSLGLAYLGYTLGENWHHLETYFRKLDYVIAALLVIGAIWWLRRHVFKKAKS